jgi:4-amino-4-deoxy-L-arabinose transferase-like glycosyltransferase
VWWVALAVTAVLLAFANRYGYHRDELYFLEAGKHLSWGYPDQPPLVPALARLLSAIGPNAVWVLRIPSALAAGATILLTTALARRLGGDQGAQLLSAMSMGVAGLLLGADHYLNTSGFDLLFWTLLIWLVVVILRTDRRELWLLVGLVGGIALLNSDLPAIVMAAIVLAIVVVGPRQRVASPYVLIGGAIAVLIWLPYLIWQARHGWPELTVSRAIANGSSATSTSRPMLVPEALLQISPYLAPLWILGLVQLARAPALRWCRSLALAFGIVLVIFEVTGGKSYYLATMVPVFLAAGSQPMLDWIRRGGRGARTGTLIGLAIAGAINLVVTLPIIPAGDLHKTPIPALNTDPGETVAWPTYVSQIARVYRSIPAGARAETVVFTKNYGEAGAIDRFGAAVGLPTAYSPHNGFWYWGLPPNHDHLAVVVGYSRHTLAHDFAYCTQAGTLNNGLHLNDTEQGSPIWRCAGMRESWSRLWPHLKELG